VETNHNPLFVSEFTVFLLFRCFLTPIVLLSTCGIQNCSENQVYYIRLFHTVPKVLPSSGIMSATTRTRKTSGVAIIILKTFAVPCTAVPYVQHTSVE
jgi:hypothetical protein